MKHVHPTIFFTGMSSWAPLNFSYTLGGLYMSLASMWYLRRYKTAWWEKYNYIISAAFGGGVAFSALVIFFALQWNPKEFSWWGTDVLFSTIDGGVGRQTLLEAADGFGPKSWY